LHLLQVPLIVELGPVDFGASALLVATDQLILEQAPCL